MYTDYLDANIHSNTHKQCGVNQVKHPNNCKCLPIVQGDMFHLHNQPVHNSNSTAVGSQTPPASNNTNTYLLNAKSLNLLLSQACKYTVHQKQLMFVNNYHQTYS